MPLPVELPTVKTGIVTGFEPELHLWRSSLKAYTPRHHKMGLEGTATLTSLAIEQHYT